MILNTSLSRGQVEDILKKHFDEKGFILHDISWSGDIVDVELSQKARAPRKKKLPLEQINDVSSRRVVPLTAGEDQSRGAKGSPASWHTKTPTDVKVLLDSSEEPITPWPGAARETL